MSWPRAKPSTNCSGVSQPSWWTTWRSSSGSTPVLPPKATSPRRRKTSATVGRSTFTSAEAGALEPDGQRGQGRHDDEEAEAEQAERDERDRADDQAVAPDRAGAQQPQDCDDDERSGGCAEALQREADDRCGGDAGAVPAAEQQHGGRAGQQDQDEADRDGQPAAEAVGGEDREVGEGGAGDQVADRGALEVLAVGEPAAAGDEVVVVVRRPAAEAGQPDDGDGGEEPAQRDGAGVGHWATSRGGSLAVGRV